MKIFTPNLTSKLLTEVAREVVAPGSRLLDLGSGGGIVGLEVAKHCGLRKIYSSDVDPETKAAVEYAAANYSIEVDHRIGSLFSPWEGEVFNVIIDDVSGVSQKIAAVSPWFEGVPCESGDSGAILVTAVLADAAKHLALNGSIIFPIISLSDRNEILQTAKRHFKNVRQVTRRDWPMPPSMLQYMDLLNELKSQGCCDFNELSGLIICYTEVHVCSEPF